MTYLYIIGFFLIGIYLVVMGVKEYRFLLLPAIYFIFMGIWWSVDIPLEVDLQAGIYVWILRIVSAVVLVVTGVIYYFKYYRQNKS